MRAAAFPCVGWWRGPSLHVTARFDSLQRTRLSGVKSWRDRPQPHQPFPKPRSLISSAFHCRLIIPASGPASAASDCGSVDDLFDGDEAGAVPEHAVSGQAQAPRPSPQDPLKRKFEGEEDEFDDFLAEGFAAIEDAKKPRIKLEADDAAPCPSRTELARKILRQTFGHDGFRPEQEAAISSILYGRNAMVVLPTGGGKSLCYQVPAIAFEELDRASGARRGHGITIVVSPLLSLIRDQVEVLKRKGIPVDSLDSTKTWGQQKEINAKMRNGTLRLLYCPPERLINQNFIKCLKDVAGGVRLVAVDEAHCIFEWGHQFRPDYLKVARFIQEVKAERAICLTATATTNVIHDICKDFNIAKTDVFRTALYRPNLRLLARPVECASDKLEELLSFLEEHKGPTLIYVTTRRQTVQLAKELVNAGLCALPFHAGMQTEDKEATQDKFMADEVDIVVATIAFGMGIDKPNIRNVVNYGIPGSVEEYSQQVGRAGRDGKPSTCMFYLCPEDEGIRSSLAYGGTPTRDDVVSVLQNIFDDEVTALPVEGIFRRNHYAQMTEYDICASPLSIIYGMLEMRFGLIRATTSEYGEYKFDAQTEYDVATILKDQSPAAQAIIRFSKPVGGSIYSIDVRTAARILNLNRRAIVRKINELHDKGLINLVVSGQENRYQVTSKKLPQTPAEIGTLADEIFAGLKGRESDAVHRIEQVIGLVTGKQCFAYALALHFGMNLPGDKKRCGHCGFCETGVAVVMPEAPPRAPVDLNLLMETLGVIPDRDDPLFLTRVAFGIFTPRTIRIKISKNRVFGSLVGHNFNAVLDEFTQVCSQEGGKSSSVKREHSTPSINEEPTSSAYSGR
ncbi:hypothetical protein GGTG_13681 [Gaeumannomyces tritici R3-111a-1]|uniref:DNA 3'-5' helicase n=1 Tax=Gaeumannomyces tritici (strain R3-111a-1) TaxID=644352 RepID=J3PJJ5_GAET3|nr:hypothetical protein GGTG_13681 [Gaeumannomyces tritici R3-111a-1]EJT68751.1 hypothetical protein GGTG_13681 [Gaeumannomyces tritici R3-111a-1]